MGEIVSCLMNVSYGYNTYLFTICNKYGNDAEQVIDELFETVAHGIGVKNVIVRPEYEAFEEAEKLFAIDHTMRHPVLVITDCHPMALIKCREMMQANENLDRQLLKRRFAEALFHYPGLDDEPEHSEGKAIIIELGAIQDKNRLRDFLFKVATLVREEKTEEVKMEHLKERISGIVKHTGLAGLAVSVVGLFA